MGGYLAYAEYKDSGMEWLGEIPKHWGVKRLKFTSTVQPSNVDKKTDEDEESVLLCNYSDVYNNAEITSKLEFMRATATQSEIEKFLIAKDQVIVTKDSETREDIAVPAYVAEDFENVLCGYHLTQIKPKEVFGKYLFRLFQSRQFNAQFILGANGVTRFGLPQYVISNALIAVPPIEEQRSIARFLDYKTAQIDALIARKETLLKKLAEKRTALISQAVTKGLDRTLPMKDSGIEWLGEIPAHWDSVRLKHICSLVRDGTHLPPARVNKGVPLLSVRNIVNGKFINLDDDSLISEEDFKQLQKSFDVKEIDILLAIVGATLGKVAIVEKMPPFTIQRSLAVLRPKTDSCAFKFLFYFMISLGFQKLLWTNVGYSAQPGIYLGSLANFHSTVPPLEEQHRIIQFLDVEIGRIDALVTEVKMGIGKISEYRTALITNAVTGKIDVRDVMLEPEPVEAA